MVWGMVDSSMGEKNKIEIKYALKVKQKGLICKKQMWRVEFGECVMAPGFFCLSKKEPFTDTVKSKTKWVEG